MWRRVHPWQRPQQWLVCHCPRLEGTASERKRASRYCCPSNVLGRGGPSRGTYGFRTWRCIRTVGVTDRRGLYATGMLIELGLYPSAMIQHPVAILGGNSDDARLQDKPSERACKCCGEFIYSFIRTFADSGDIVFPGERSVHLLATAPGGASRGASRREHADQDK